MSQNIEIERRLAAVLAADVAGFSRLTEADEVGTMRLLGAQRAILDSAISRHRGRIANTAGDSVLAEFPSAVNAVQCAVEAQQALRDAAEAMPEDRRVLFRIGIHVGDVMVRGGDLLGTGVNVAARLEALAEAGGIVLSAAAHEQVRKILPLAYTDLGAQSVKNIEEPVRALAIGASTTPAAPLPGEPKPLPLPLPDKPSIAVLPFQNMSGDVEQEYFADGMVEDIITALSRFKSLFVIARNSSFSYKGKSPDIRQVGRELGVRYVLEGSVRKAGNRVRITGQLIEAATNNHIWADKFDGSLDDIFSLQDSVTQEVVGVIAPAVERAETVRAYRRGTPDHNAYEYFMRGLARAVEYGPEATEAALEWYRKSLDIDPRYAAAHGRIGMAFTTKAQNHWLRDDTEIETGIRHARLAIEYSGDDAVALADGGLALAHLAQDLETGADCVARALQMNANSATVWHRSATMHIYLGAPETALEHIAVARRLSPVDIQMLQMMQATAAASFFAGKYEEAVLWAGRALQLRPRFLASLMTLAAAQAMMGKPDAAKQTCDQLLQLHPDAHAVGWLKRPPFFREIDGRAMPTALRLAGLPE